MSISKIISVVGARPNFMKMAPVDKQIKKYIRKYPDSKLQHIICHTGQHYDDNMSKIFFDDLELPKPGYYLNVGSGSHSVQTAGIMIEFEKIILHERPDLIIVYGDVNSTVACSLVAAKMGVKIAHIEAGLRSFDREMPEEINRILTDHLADYLFVTEIDGTENLKREGIAKEKIFLTGNVMIDSLVYYLPKIESADVIERFNLLPSNYILVTLHRPSNVDNIEKLKIYLDLLSELAEKRKIIFPMHPRTRDKIADYNPILSKNLIITYPLGYLDFLALLKNAELVLTDSGGMQEETTYLGVQCLTLRNNTERPVTIEVGTNQLIGTEPEKIRQAVLKILEGKIRKGRIPEYWDGKTAQRILNTILNCHN